MYHWVKGITRVEINNVVIQIGQVVKCLKSVTVWDNDNWNLLKDGLYTVKAIHNKEWGDNLIYMIEVEEKQGILDFEDYTPVTEQEQFLYYTHGSEALLKEEE